MGKIVGKVFKDDIKLKSVSKMNKQELVEYALANNIEINAEAKVDEIRIIINKFESKGE